MNKVTFVMEIYCLRLNIEWFLDSLKIEYKMHTGFLNYFLVPLYNKRHYYSKSEQLITLVLVYCISTKICFEEEKRKKLYWLTLIFLALALIVDFCFSFDLFELIHFFIKNVLDLVWFVSLLYSWETWFQRSDFCWSVAVGSSALNSLTNDSNVLILILPFKKRRKMVIDVNSKEKFNYFLKKLLFYVSLHFFWSRTAGFKGPKLSNAAEWKKTLILSKLIFPHTTYLCILFCNVI